MKKIKRLIAGVGAFCLAFSITAPSLISASAETTINLSKDETYTQPSYSSMNRYDEYFEMSQDITVHSVKEDGSATLRFPLIVKNENFYKMSSDDDIQMEISFSVVRDSELGQTKISTYHFALSNEDILFDTKNPEDVIHIARTYNLEAEANLSTGTSLAGKIDILPKQYEIDNMKGYVFEENGFYRNGTYYEKGTTAFEDDPMNMYCNDLGDLQYEAIYGVGERLYPLILDKSGTYPTIYIDVPVMSATSNYFIHTQVNKNYLGAPYTTGALWWQETKRDYMIKYRNIKSPSVNVKSLLEDMQESGDLGTILPEDEQTNADNIIQNTATKEVTISYLEQVGRTPFAVRVNKKVTVPILNDNLRYDDVCVALGKKSLTCLGASWNGFEKDTFEVYTAQYLTSTYLQVVDQSGKYDEHYFKLEKSYTDFVSEFESAGIFEDGMFDFALNDIKRMYPSMEEYDGDEIYGLWGYVVVPETANWTSIFTESVFKVPEEFNGILKRYEKQGRMNQANYHKILQEEYDYTWGEAINSAFWTSILTGSDTLELPCKHYFFYADPKISNVSMEEGSLNDAGKDFIGSVSDTLNGIFENNEEETAKNPFRTILIISGTALGTVGVVAIVFFFKKGKKRK